MGDYHYTDFDMHPRLPVDEHARWDDEGIEAITFDKWTCDPSGTRLLMFHDACWAVLRTCFHHAEIPLERLAIAFRMKSEYRIHQTSAGESWDLHYGDDPSETLTVEHVLCPAYSLPNPSRQVAQRWNRNAGLPSRDIFAQFPMEVRQEMAQHLSGIDFCNIRLASRSMSYLFFSQAFWRTRFGADGDRGFLCCLDDGKNKSHDWQLLYHCSNASNRSGMLDDRKQIWERARWLRNICLLTVTSDPSEMSFQDLDEAEWDCKEVQALLPCDKDLPFPPEPLYVNVLRKQGVYLPGFAVTVHISFIRQRDITFVTGLKFVSGGKSTSMGYAFPGSWIMYETKQFKGFQVALSEKGIHALRIIAVDYPCPLSWVGSTHKASITNRLVLQEKVDALEASFDVSTYDPLRIYINSSLAPGI